MKKLFVLSLLVMTTFMAQAQVKIAPELTKGKKMVYENVTNSSVGGTDVTTISEMVYEVASVTADGAIINMTMTKMEATGGNEMSRMIMTLTDNATKGVTIKVKTDKDGCAKSIVNFDEVKKKGTAAVEKFIDEIITKYPEVTQMLSREALLKQANNQMTEEVILRGIVSTPTNALALNGKTIRNMMQDNYTNSQNIKMKRMFFVTNGGKNITTNANADMSGEELKAFIIEQVEQVMPAQADMIKQNIDAVMASGMVKIEATEKTTYEMANDGWIKSATMNSDMNMMGQKVKTTSKLTLK